MGRLGLDPSTLRTSQARSHASVSIHLSWSKDKYSSPASADVLSNLLVRLHNWLHELDFDLVGEIRSQESSGRIIETIIDVQ